jgi:hypothetical protein
MTTFAVTMNSLDKYMSDFLLLHDSLVVPQFGGFVSRKVAAHLSENSNRILPPSKQILFHFELDLTDGVLERYISSRKKITLDESIAFINDTVLDWKKALKKGDRLEFDKIGVFYQNQEGQIRFIQDRNQNLLRSSYGLCDIRYAFEEQELPTTAIVEMPSESQSIPAFVPVMDSKVNSTQEPSEAVITSSEEEKVILVQEPVSPNGKSTKRFWIRAAAAAVIVPFLFYSFWVPLKTNVLETKTLAFVDFNPFHNIEKPQFNANKLNDFEPENINLIDVDHIINSLPVDAHSFNFNYDADLVIPVKIKDAVIPKIELNNNAVASTNTQQNAFNVIVGCFSEKSNAQKQLKDLKSKGYNAYIVDVKGGLHRVAAGGSNSQQEAIQLSQELQNQGLSVWTLKK